MDLRLTYTRHQRLIQTAVIILAVAAAYGHTIGFPFYFDDQPNIIERIPLYADSSNFETLRRIASLRLVGYLTFALNYHFHQFDVTGYHLVNILIHILAGLSILWFTGSLTGTPALKGRITDSLAAWLPLLSALIFVLHPLQTQAVTYIVQRLASLAALFYITALACYIQARLAARRRGMILWGTGAVLAAILAFFTKQNAATLPIAIFLVEVIFFPSRTKHVLIMAAGMICALLAGYFALAVISHRSPFSLETLNGLTSWKAPFSRIEYLAHQPAILWSYIRMFFWPSGLHVDHYVPPEASFTDLSVLIAAAAHLGVVTGALLAIKKYPLPAFGVLFYYTAHLVESSVIPIKDLMFEHRTYLPNLGLCMFTAWLILSIRKKVKFQASWLVIILLIALGTATWFRNNVWRDPVTLWRDCVAKSPDKARPHNNLGFSIEGTGNLTRALDEYREAVRLEPDYATALYNLGRVQQKFGRFDEAEKNLLAAIRFKPDYAEAYNNLGIILLNKGKTDESIENLAKAVKIAPEYAGAHYNLGNALQSQGRYKEARIHLLEALRLQPDNANPHNTLGLILLQQGDTEGAVDQFREALMLDPEYALAHFNLGRALFRKEKLDEAAGHFREALRINPEFTVAKKALNSTLFRLEKGKK